MIEVESGVRVRDIDGVMGVGEHRNGTVGQEVIEILLRILYYENPNNNAKDQSQS